MEKNKLEIQMLENEYWWGGCVNLGHEMPYGVRSEGFFDLNGGRENDQFAPLMLSSKGRYVWGTQSFQAGIKNGRIQVNGQGEIQLFPEESPAWQDGNATLRGAYLTAMKERFPFTGKMPDKLFWQMPQYNTWIELGTEQTTEKILNYARGILVNGLPAGILMIDGGWQEDYGVFEFHRGKIPEPKYLIDSLHDLGFKVMLWVSPIVASAGSNYKQLRDKGYLVKNAEGKPAIREWWSGYSAVLDFTNPKAVQWYREKLDRLMQCYGVDGFKFDAGDRYFYADDDITFQPVTAREQTGRFNEVGEAYAFNEFRAAWNYGGKAIVARLHDKYHTWDSFGLNTLIPHTILQGLCGYAYCCPDMVGGGIIDSFSPDKQIDEELFIRWVQANALMGMMQISIAPWRIFGEETYAIIRKYILLHEQMGSYCVKLAEEAAKSGEPIVRHMAYQYPDQEFETVNDQFMLGDHILSAPVLEKGKRERAVKLPEGLWKESDGTVYEGGQTIIVEAPLEKLPWFERVDKRE